MHIEFDPQRDDVDPRPAKEDTAFLKERGWLWQRKEKVWSRQLGKNTEDDHMARANSDKDAETHFFELGNRIRERNGLEPVSYHIGNTLS